MCWADPIWARPNVLETVCPAAPEAVVVAITLPPFGCSIGWLETSTW